MIVFGIVMLLLGVLLGLGGLWMTTANDSQLRFDFGPLALSMSPAVLFVLGMIAIGLVWLGVWATGFGTRRSMEARREASPGVSESEAAAARPRSRWKRGSGTTPTGPVVAEGDRRVVSTPDGVPRRGTVPPEATHRQEPPRV